MADSGKDMELEEPQSRVEKILAKAAGTYTGDVEEPQSRIEKLLIALNDVIAAAGSGGSKFVIVDSLPSKGEDNTIYLLKDAEMKQVFEKEYYHPYVWSGNAFIDILGVEVYNANWSVEYSDEIKYGYIENKPPIREGEGGGSLMEGYYSGNWNNSTGNYSHAEGKSTTSSGENSHAEGASTTAGGKNSHAEGYSAAAYGKGSHAEGGNTEAGYDYSHAEGYETGAASNYSHAEGYGSITTGRYSHAEGSHTIAGGESSHVVGRYNIKDEKNLYAEIVGNGSSETRSNARTLDWSGNEVLAGKLTMGADPTEDMDAATKKYVDGLMGAGATAQPDWNETSAESKSYIQNKPAISAGSGSNAVVEGSDTKAEGEDSHAEGYSSSASGNYAHAEGYWSKASKVAAHAEGFSSTASGNDSHAEGNSTTADGIASHAEGSNTTANGMSSHAEGYYTVANGSYQHVCGKYNVGDGSGTQGAYAEIVGNGTGESARSNARTLDWNGNEVLAGKLTMGSAPSQDMDAATKKYVDDLIADIQAKIDALTPAGS